MNFKKRSTLPELMDNPNLPKADLQLALRDLAVVNKYLGGDGITINALEALIAENPDKQKWKIIDVGCGDGEMLRKIATHFQDETIDIDFLGLDLNPKSIASAVQKTRLCNVNFEEKDILTLNTQDYQCDIVLFTLTIHHFTDAQIVDFITKCQEIAAIAIVINDLQRSKLAHRLFQLFSGIFMKSNIAIYDGKVSIARSFKREDLETYSKKLALNDYSISWKWAFRYLWVIKIK